MPLRHPNTIPGSIILLAIFFLIGIGSVLQRRHTENFDELGLPKAHGANLEKRLVAVYQGSGNDLPPGFKYNWTIQNTPARSQFFSSYDALDRFVNGADFIGYNYVAIVKTGRYIDTYYVAFSKTLPTDTGNFIPNTDVSYSSAINPVDGPVNSIVAGYKCCEAGSVISTIDHTFNSRSGVTWAIYDISPPSTEVATVVDGVTVPAAAPFVPTTSAIDIKALLKELDLQIAAYNTATTAVNTARLNEANILAASLAATVAIASETILATQRKNSYNSTHTPAEQTTYAALQDAGVKLAGANAAKAAMDSAVKDLVTTATNNNTQILFLLEKLQTKSAELNPRLAVLYKDRAFYQKDLGELVAKILPTYKKFDLALEHETKLNTYEDIIGETESTALQYQAWLYRYGFSAVFALAAVIWSLSLVTRASDPEFAFTDWLMAALVVLYLGYTGYAAFAAGLHALAQRLGAWFVGVFLRADRFLLQTPK